MDGSDDGTTFTDSSSHARTVTRVGSPVTKTGEKKYGTASCYFGTRQANYLTLPDHDDWHHGTSDFTIEMWAYITATTTSLQVDFGGQSNTDPSDAGGNYSLQMTPNQHDDLKFNVYQRNGTNANDDFAVEGTTQIALNQWVHLAATRDGNTMRVYQNGVQTGSGAISSAISYNLTSNNLGGKWYIGARAYAQTYGYIPGYLDEYRLSDNCRFPNGTTFTPGTSSITNATGTLIQSANAVGSAKTKVGGTMLYKDAYGTATLGTDLKIYFSCNNGGAWTEAASYNAITPVYSTGIKQVRLGETTCTSGTGVIYKAVWANQAAGSKDTQLHGIGINY